MSRGVELQSAAKPTRREECEHGSFGVDELFTLSVCLQGRAREAPNKPDVGEGRADTQSGINWSRRWIGLIII